MGLLFTANTHAVIPVQHCSGNVTLTSVASGHPTQFVETVCPIPDNVVRTHAVCGDLERYEKGKATGEINPKLLRMESIHFKQWNDETSSWYSAFIRETIYRHDEFDIDYVITCPNSNMQYRGTHKWHAKREAATHTDFDTELEGGIAFDGALPVTAYSNITGTIDVPVFNEGANRAHLKAILKDWRNRKVPVVDGFNQIVEGRLAQPVLFVHGIESNYKAWGITNETEGLAGLTPEEVYEQGVVVDYEPGSIPDLLAHTYGLRRDFSLNQPLDGINNNGIYFFNGNIPQNPTNPSVPIPGDTPLRDQARMLYDRLVAVLDKHFVDANGVSNWRTNPNAKINLVAHSQGGIVVRHMVIEASKNIYPVGVLNAANHVGRFISLDSPHFGAAIATSIGCNPNINEVKLQYGEEFAAFGDVLKQLQCTDIFKDQVIAKGTSNLAWWVSAAAGTAGGCTLGFAGGVLVEGIGGALGCAAGGLLGGTVGGIYGVFADDEIEATLKGPIFGPYSLEVNSPLPDFTLNIKALESTRKELAAVQQRHTDLGKDSPAITELYRNIGTPYPRKPDGTFIDFLPIYSEDVRGLEAEFVSQLTGGVMETCKSGSLSKAERAACLDVGSYLSVKAEELLGTFGTASVNEGNAVMRTWQGVRDGWAVKSDIAVQGESQKYENPISNISTQDGNQKTAGATKPTRTYLLHRAQVQNPSEKMVPHMKIDFQSENEWTGPISVFHAGSTLMGRDVTCALQPSCDAMAASGGLPVITRPTQTTISLSESGTEIASSQSVALRGDFQLSVGTNHSTSRGFQLKTSTGVIALEVLHEQNGSVTARGPNQATVTLAQALPWQGLAVFRVGNLLKVHAGTTEIFSFTAASGFLGQDLTLNVFTDGQNVPDILGHFTPADPASQIRPPADGKVAIWYRQGAGSQTNASRLRFMIYNGSTQTVTGIKMVYYFTVPANKTPVAEAIRAAGLTWRVENLGSNGTGGVNYRLIAEGPAITLAPGALYPDAQGWDWQLRNQDGSEWDIFDDWSNADNIGLPLPNRRIALYNAAGDLLWGKEPQLDRVNLVNANRLPKVQLSANDGETGNTAQRRPRITLRNVGEQPLPMLTVVQFFKAPLNKTLSLGDDYTPKSHLKLKSLGNGWYSLSADVGTHGLSPGATMEVGQYRVHTSDWSVWPRRTATPVPDLTSQTVASTDILVYWGENLIWGTVPNLDVTPPTPVDPGTTPTHHLVVMARDEQPQDGIYIRPRIQVRNSSTQPVRGFRVTMPFKVTETAAPLLDAPWYVPGCQTALKNTSGQNWQVELNCADVTLAQGETWPDQGGAVLGLHLVGFAPWSRQDDLAFKDLTQTFTLSTGITAQGWE